MGEFIDVRREGDIAIITLNRPEKLNAWHRPMRMELKDAFRANGEDPAVRAIIRAISPGRRRMRA